MSRSVILDPRSERAANAPLEIHTEPARGAGIYTRDSWRWPDPEITPRRSQHREGQRSAGPPILGNRKIGGGLYIVGRRDSYAADRTNLTPRPSPDVQQGWSHNAGGTVDPASGYSTAWSRIRERSRYLKATSTGAGQSAQIIAGDTLANRATVVAATTYAISLWTLLRQSTGAGGLTLALEWRTAADAVISTTSVAVTPTLGEESRISAIVAAPATATNVRVLFGRAGNLANGEIFEAYADALLVEATGDLREYFDGDEPGRAWTGAAQASTSTEPGDPDVFFERMMGALEEKLAKIRDDGGAISRSFKAGRLTFDLEGVDAREGEYQGRQWLQRGQPDSVLFEARPYGRETTQTRTLITQTTDPVCVFSEANVAGSAPSLAELEIADTAAQARRGIVGGIQVADSSADATALFYYQAEALTPLGTAVLAARTGAVGAGNNVVRLTLSQDWQPIFSTKIAASGLHLTHIGLFRFWIRLNHSVVVNNVKIHLALEWAQGDLGERELTPATIINSRSGFALIEIASTLRLRRALAGVQRWEGRLLARAESGAPQIEIDDVRIVPAGEAYLRIAAPMSLAPPTTYTAKDAFNQTAGDLNAKVADVGGAWVTSGGVGDYTLDTALARITRESTETTERFAVSGAVAQTATVARVYFEVDGNPAATYVSGPLARWIDSNNFVRATAVRAAFEQRLRVVKKVAGVETELASVSGLYTGKDIALYVSTLGAWAVYAVTPGGDLAAPIATGSDPVLATAGALASGKVGIYDGAGGNVQRRFDNFSAYAPVEPVVMFPSRRLRWRHDGVLREDTAGGDLWSDIGYEGDPLILPPKRREGRVLRGIVFPTRSDLADVPDAGESDDFTIQLSLIPRHVTVRA